jgi:hypothetical protein
MADATAAAGSQMCGGKIEKPRQRGLTGFFMSDLKGRSFLHDTFALGALAGQLAGAAHGFSALAGFLLGRLFKRLTRFHFPEQAFALHLLLQRAQGLLNVIIADDDLYYRTSPSGSVRAAARKTGQIGPDSPESAAYITGQADSPSPSLRGI